MGGEFCPKMELTVTPTLKTKQGRGIIAGIFSSNFIINKCLLSAQCLQLTEFQTSN